MLIVVTSLRHRKIDVFRRLAFHPIRQTACAILADNAQRRQDLLSGGAMAFADFICS
jgi:hypothetical protein